MDLLMDVLPTGRRLKCLTFVDGFTRESVDLILDHTIPGQYAARVLDQTTCFRGYPAAIRTRSGPEFTSKALDQWATNMAFASR